MIQPKPFRPPSASALRNNFDSPFREIIPKSTVSSRAAAEAQKLWKITVDEGNINVTAENNDNILMHEKGSDIDSSDTDLLKMNQNITKIPMRNTKSE